MTSALSGTSSSLLSRPSINLPSLSQGQFSTTGVSFNKNRCDQNQLSTSQSILYSPFSSNCLPCLGLCVQSPIQTLSGCVVSVSNGDTITVLDQNNQQHKIRLNGVESRNRVRTSVRLPTETSLIWSLGKMSELSGGSATATSDSSAE